MGTMKTNRLLAPLVTLAAFAAVSLASAQDVRLGGARTFGLGGAGVALPLDVWETHRLNPALLGFADKRLRYGIPYIGYHAKNLSVGDLSKASKDIDSNSNLDQYARDFGNDTKELGLSFGEGLSFAGFAFSVAGDADARSIPNASLKEWANSSADLSTLPDDARLDAYGLATYDVAGSYGRTVLDSREKVAVGATARFASAYYAHKFVDAEAIQNDGNGQNAPEIGNGNAVNKSGFGADFGVLASTERLKNFTVGANAHNLIEPNVRFARTDTEANAIGDLRPFQRHVDVGAAYVASDRYLAALDLVDLGNHAGVAGVRAGAEYTVTRFFSVRAGYDSRASVAVGLSLFGVNAAFDAKGTATLTTALRF